MKNEPTSAPASATRSASCIGYCTAAGTVTPAETRPRATIWLRMLHANARALSTLVLSLSLSLSLQLPLAWAQGPGSALDTVQTEGVLRACTPGDYRPFAHGPTDGRIEGIDIDLLQSFAQSIPARVEIVRTTWSGLMDDFHSRGCHLALGGISVTLDRLKKASFSQPYMTNGKTPVVRCEDVARFDTVADINRPEVRVVANPGGTNEKFARDSFSRAQLRIHTDNLSIFDEILQKRADVFVTESAEARVQQKLHSGLCAVHPERPFTFGEIGWMLPRGDTAWKAYVDQWLRVAQVSGQFQTVVDRWLPQ